MVSPAPTCHGNASVACSIGVRGGEGPCCQIPIVRDWQPHPTVGTYVCYSSSHSRLYSWTRSAYCKYLMVKGIRYISPPPEFNPRRPRRSRATNTQNHLYVSTRSGTAVPAGKESKKKANVGKGVNSVTSRCTKTGVHIVCQLPQRGSHSNAQCML